MKHHETWNTMKPKSVEATHMKAVSAPVRTLRNEGRVLALEISLWLNKKNATAKLVAKTNDINQHGVGNYQSVNIQYRHHYMTKPKESIRYRANPSKSPYIWIVWFPKWVPWPMTTGNMSMSSKFGELPPPKKKKLPKLSGSLQWVFGVKRPQKKGRIRIWWNTNCLTGIPKPWKMKVLHLQIWVITPKFHGTCILWELKLHMFFMNHLKPWTQARLEKSWKKEILRIVVWTLQQRGVNDSVCRSWDLQITSFEIPWFLGNRRIRSICSCHGVHWMLPISWSTAIDWKMNSNGKTHGKTLHQPELPWFQSPPTNSGPKIHSRVVKTMNPWEFRNFPGRLFGGIFEGGISVSPLWSTWLTQGIKSLFPMACSQARILRPRTFLMGRGCHFVAAFSMWREFRNELAILLNWLAFKKKWKGFSVKPTCATFHSDFFRFADEFYDPFVR